MEAKYNKIGIDYNRTRKADKYLTEQILLHLDPSIKGLYLDIGCGTGNYTLELQKRGFHFIGIDPSGEMLDKAKANPDSHRNPQIDWRIGTSENTGLSNNGVDGIIGFLTIHHWSDLNKAFSELNRILKPKCKIVIFTSTPSQMKGYWLNHYFPKMMNASINQMPSLETVEAAMENSGLQIVKMTTYSVKPNLEDFFLYCGKHYPERYFDEKIRSGISSFSSLANLEEVQEGLSNLRKDINNGKIAQIIKSFENELGDYFFIIAEKPNGNKG